MPLSNPLGLDLATIATLFQEQTIALLIVNILILLAIVFSLVFLGFVIGHFWGLKKTKSLVSEARKDAVKRSRSVLSGQLNEQIAPYLPHFPANANDAHFLGKPVDFICFSGLSESDDITEILFVEVKTGTSTLSNREKAVKAAIDQGRVRYVVYKPEA